MWTPFSRTRPPAPTPGAAPDYARALQQLHAAGLPAQLIPGAPPRILGGSALRQDGEHRYFEHSFQIAPEQGRWRVQLERGPRQVTQTHADDLASAVRQLLSLLPR